MSNTLHLRSTSRVGALLFVPWTGCGSDDGNTGTSAEGGGNPPTGGLADSGSGTGLTGGERGLALGGSGGTLASSGGSVIGVGGRSNGSGGEFGGGVGGAGAEQVQSGGNASGGAVEGEGGSDATGGTMNTGGSGEVPVDCSAISEHTDWEVCDCGADYCAAVFNVGPAPCACQVPAGEWGTVDETIVVEPGEVYDGQCLIFRANPSTLGPGDQSEDQSPVFRVEDGGTLRNVVLGASAADGIHLYGDVVLENIHWLDIGEDAMTVKESGTVYLDCGSAADGEDKMFQVNAESEIHISNFTGSNAGKFMRQNGDTTFVVAVTIDHCDISNMDEAIFRTDSSTSHVTLTNTRYSSLGDGLFIFGDEVVNGDSSQSTVSNCIEY